MIGELTCEEREVLETVGRPLLRQAGVNGDASFERLAGGRNNRVYRACASDKQAVVKWYFHHPQDQRDRLDAEYSFCEFARASGIDSVAAALARDDENRLAVYSWIDGRTLTVEEIGQDYVDQAIQFLAALNAHRDGATELPEASEACYSLQQHIDLVVDRVARLSNIAPDGETHLAASQFVHDRLAPTLRQRIDRITSWAESTQVDLSLELRHDQRCVSPSDFGFHNALLTPSGKLAFVDFEYAGWDDPAKTICDFYCQPKLPAPRATWERFASLVTSLAADTAFERERPTRLFPLYQVKWCCILLNEFAVADHARRQFAEGTPWDLEQQLKKVIRFADKRGFLDR